MFHLRLAREIIYSIEESRNGAEFLRDYQIELVREIADQLLEGNKRILVQSPTGSGKSVIFKFLLKCAEEIKMRSFLCVHKKFLIDQAKHHLAAAGIKHGLIWKTNNGNPYRLTQVAAIDTLKNRLDKIQVGADFIIYDEAHHLKAGGWLRTYNHFGNAVQIGLTATPIRTDKKGFDDIFDVIICGKQVKWLMDQGYLANYKIYAPFALSTEGVKMKMGDFDPTQLEEKINTREIAAEVVSSWEKFSYGEKTVVFCVSPAHSKRVVEEYNNYGLEKFGRKIAAHIDGETPEHERDEILRKFSLPTGDLDGYLILSNYGIFAEGYDLPDCVTLQDLRPTKSLSTWLQMVGRVLRPGKPFAKILDHSRNIFRHGFPDAERTWNLAGMGEAKIPLIVECPSCLEFGEVKSTKYHNCPSCGFNIYNSNEPVKISVSRNRDIDHDSSVELEELEFSESDKNILNQITQLANLKGKKKTEALKNLLANKPSYAELQKIGQGAKMPKNWARNTYREMVIAENA